MPALPQIPFEWLPKPYDTDWVKLDEFQKADVLRRLQLLVLVVEELDRGGGKMAAIKRASERAQEMQLGARARNGIPLRNDGLGRPTLYRLICAWENSARAWKSIARFSDLIKDKAHALRATKLSVKKVKAFLRRNGHKKPWCKAHGISLSAVETLLSSRRYGEPAVLDVAQKIREAIRQRVAALRCQLSHDRLARAKLDRKIAAAEAELREIGDSL